MKRCTILIFILLGMASQAQTTAKNTRIKILEVRSDTLKIDSVSISPFHFKLYDSLKTRIDSTKYQINFAKAQLILDKERYTSVIVEYQSLPSFLTKSYAVFNKNSIVPKKTDLSKLYSANTNKRDQFFKPFDGLNTSGSLSRGFTVGNNQDAVLNSNLDLQISGFLSDKVQLRASITDTNIPLQDGGYTQRLDEFDRVFIELLSENWSVKAGDVNLENQSSNFLRFNKKVAGIAVDATLNHSNGATKAFVSGAVVRGQFARNEFVGQEANQGPYKIAGANSEALLLIISGSETVFVNGIALKRGENNDYVIDYNTAEITFTPTFPVNANMRIAVEYQFSERNYTRFVTYNGADYASEKFNVGFNFYSENDAKNQTLQQELSDSQRALLATAGDDRSQMVVPSARPEAYTENAILYKKEIADGIETFVFSTDANDDLFNVRFSYVGVNQGNYRVQTTIASGRIFEYAPPVSGMLQGDYEPIIQLIAPTKLQIATVHASYNPSLKTAIKTELAYSINDQNLFSSLNDSDNNGVAGKLNWEQVLLDKAWSLKGAAGFEFIDQNFKTIERFRNVEFNRDWDLVNPLGNQQFFNSSLRYAHESKGGIQYAFEQLRFSENFEGTRHNLFSDLKLKGTRILATGSMLTKESPLSDTQFLRWYSTVKQHFKKNWLGATFNTEHNERTSKITSELDPLSHKYIEYEAFAGVGDTASVFVEVGYNYRTTDSVQVNSFQKVNNTNTYFLKSNLIQHKNANLSLYANYRTVNNRTRADEEALNTRIQYRQQLFNNGISMNTVYETNSGSLPQQEFSYIEVEPGQGFYAWFDYNDNGIQELDEFEVSQFQDEAIYVRLVLPTTKFIKTHQNKFSQSLTLNPTQWQSKNGFKKVLSHFINQSFVLIDSKQERTGVTFNINPFNLNDQLLALNFSLKNSLFFNRGQQHFSSAYTYLDTRNKTAFAVGTQENTIQSHQLQFIHKLGKFWLLDLTGIVSENTSTSESFTSRNFKLDNYTFHPMVSYVYNTNSRFETFYILKSKENRIGAMEFLKTHTLGANFLIANKEKASLTANINVIFNEFEGNQNSPVAFQMLEGLQAGTNYTWTLNLQKKLTSYLDINLNYLGRKSETSKAIHTGTLQLRASF
tara:strand:+ start:65503 stop:68895 length:3393 start_codon:yes stop_codon:yes gene_type:complete